MPHFPARIIKNKQNLNDWISKYKNEAGVEDALLIIVVLKNHMENLIRQCS